MNEISRETENNPIDMTEHRNYIAENLAFLLKKNHLSPSQLAQSLKLPIMTIRRLLSGETIDPRISTLKMLAEYFNVSVDYFMKQQKENSTSVFKSASNFFLPKLSWEDLENLKNPSEIIDKNWAEWESISLPENNTLSDYAFALETRPLLFPRYPKGTIFIIEPEASPNDEDIVLVKFKYNNNCTLKKFIIDPPNYKFYPLVKGSDVINYNSEEHEIIGISLLIIYYSHKLNGY